MIPVSASFLAACYFRPQPPSAFDDDDPSFIAADSACIYTTMSEISAETPQHFLVGVKGVRLKKFERVVAAILPHVQPDYVELPPLANSADAATDWPFDKLPAAARVLGSLEGQLSDTNRATRKENQLRSMLRCVLALLPKAASTTIEKQEASYTIVDFGGGTGHLAIPLAILLPSFRVIVVDLSELSLQLLRRKAKGIRPCSVEQAKNSSDEIALSKDCLQRCEGIPNLFTFYGPVESFHEPFDMAVALHLCGEATDVALRKCGQVQAQALICAPCCVGKLNREKKNPYIYQANGTNTPTVSYPQSKLFCQFLDKQEDWNALARAADYSDMDECRTSRNAARRTAKALLETDRRLFLEESFSYKTALTRMDPWEATPKNDILLAWSNDIVPSFQCMSDQECLADIQLTINHLLVPDATSAGYSVVDKGHVDSVDWTRDEEQEVCSTLQGFVSSQSNKMVFPTGLGGRKRKLIHYVAEQMGLAHWCEGKKYADKTVAVSRRRIHVDEQ